MWANPLNGRSQAEIKTLYEGWLRRHDFFDIETGEREKLQLRLWLLEIGQDPDAEIEHVG